MDNTKIEEFYTRAVKAKVEKSTALGTKATWSMSDHLDVAAAVLVECVKDEVNEAQIRDVVQKTYNHSAFAQKLEKAFAATGHFQREGKSKVTYDDYLTKLAKESAGAVVKAP